jgi:tRNA 2-thiouridine synthesizing protein C
MEIHFLFTEHIPLERLGWLSKSFDKGGNSINPNAKNSETNIDISQFGLFLTGDALFSLIDKRYRPYWKKLISVDNFFCNLDSEEIKLLGLECKERKKLDIETELNNTEIHSNTILQRDSDFWNGLLNSIHNQFNGNRIGLLEFQGPYMSRTTVNALRLLEKAIDYKLDPELYTYLDGIHMGHIGQKPSEYENIGKKLRYLEKKARMNDLRFIMLSCSRCGTARGYIREKKEKEYFQSDDVIPHYLFCNLNKIVERFEENNLILSASCGIVQYCNDFDKDKLNKKKASKIKPPIIIFITHNPYGSEWTFGGLSFAMAYANHEIPTKVVFIEDGTYNLPTEHKLSSEDKMFNIQDIILATSDMEFLEYYVLDESLKIRNFDLVNKLNNYIEKINNIELTRLIISKQDNSITHKRIIFF